MLTGTARRLTASERAREPRSLGVIAYFDGWARHDNPHHTWATYPRRLTTDEARSWREGWDDARAEQHEHARRGAYGLTLDADGYIVTQPPTLRHNARPPSH